MPRNSSKTWLKTLISRQSSRSLRSDEPLESERRSMEEVAFDEVIIDSDETHAHPLPPRAVVLEADRQARLERYRQEASEYQAEEAQRRQSLQLEQHLRQQQKAEQRQTLARLQPRSPVLPMPLGSENGIPAIPVDEEPGLEPTDGFQPEPSTPKLPIQSSAQSSAQWFPALRRTEDVQRQNRRIRRARRSAAVRRARQKLSPKQRLIRVLRSVVRTIAKGFLWVARQCWALVKGLLLRLYRWIAPIARRHQWKFIISGISSAALLTAGTALWLMFRVPPAPKCDQIPAWAVDSERLTCAQLSTESGNPEDILRGIALVENWEADHPLYNQAQRSLSRWTEQLLVVARQKLETQDLDGAIALAQKIPKTSPLYAEVQREVNDWQEARNLGQKLYDRMQVALQKQAWDEASGHLAKLANINDPTWQKRLVELRRSLEVEKAAGALLKQARDFAKSRPPEQWGSAIALTDPINRKTFVWEAAQKDIAQWRDKVFDLAIAQVFTQKNPEVALNLVKTIPSNIDLTPEQQTFVHFAQASAIAREAQNLPLLQQWGRLAMAQQLIALIPTDSQFHKPANALLPDLVDKGEDTAQIAVARTIANLGPTPFLQGAIAQAEQIAPKRPNRVEAQTLIAQWRRGLQKLEDRPLIAQGEQLAKRGDINAYRQAVDLIDRVGKTRTLYADAQRRKGEWIAQIQTLEDKPILASARAQAAAGNLSQAMQTARKIASGRALYAEAQREVGGWADQLQAIADRAAMERAAELAAKGNLSQAIDVASSVSSSVVSREARSSISQWSAEREMIRRSQAPMSAPEVIPERRREDPTPPAPAADPTPMDTPPDPAPYVPERPVDPVPSSPAVESEPTPPAPQ